MRPLESVPNVSEGRDAATIRAIAGAFAAGGAQVLDVHSDADHHRSVLTLIGGEAELGDSLVAGVAAAVASIDLRSHDGVHPRVGAADVVPIVALDPLDAARAAALALVVAGRIGDELRLPVFLYGDSGDGRRPAYFRAGGLDGLRARVERGELVPDFGPRLIDPRAGAVLVGARPPLVAFNLELDTGDVEVARAVAAEVRASGGGMDGVQAIGLLLDRTGRAQVSLNVIDIERAPLHLVVARVREASERRGARVVRGELVGLMPASVAVAGGSAAAFALDDLPDHRLVETYLAG